MSTDEAASIQQSAILEGLNEEQFAAVTHIDGPLLTLAGPGSGKTRVVTNRIANLLFHGISPYNILALTFTNKAAEEMRLRLERLVGQTPVWLGTFHGYCARFLRVHGRAVGLPQNFSIYDPSDCKIALRTAVDSAQVSLTHLNIDQIAREISNLKNRLVTPEVVETNTRSSTEHIISRVYPAYQKELLKNGAVDFDDLLLHTAVLLRNYPDLRRELDAKHKYILVDEYQDTNFAQYVIMRSLSIDHPNLNVTGDPDQSVYGWRGANIRNILNFEKDYPNVQVVRLENNYRSTPEILSVADALISHNRQRKEKHLIPTREGGSPVRLVVYGTDRDEASQIAESIARGIQEEGQRASQYAILYRTNAHSRLLEQALLARGIAYQMIGGFRFYQRQEIKDMLSYLALLNNPTDDVAFTRVINMPPRGFGKKTLESIVQLGVDRKISMLAALQVSLNLNLLSAKAAKGAKDFLKLFDELGAMAIGPVVDLLNHLLKRTDYIAYLEKKKQDEIDGSVRENINELLADAQQVDIRHPEGDGLEYFLEQVALLSDADSWEATSERVTLMTLHSAKGLEFDNVFIIGVEQDVLPHIRSKDDPNQLEEERRLFFVGITRARDNLQISVAHRRGFGQSRLGIASPFLMELPRSEMQLVDLTTNSGFHHDAEGWYGDEYSQFSPSNSNRRKNLKLPVEFDNDSSQLDFESDDHCQLPPDELAQRLESMMQKNRVQKFGIVKTGADLLASNKAAGLEVGVKVTHASYGAGEILSIDGRGLKRICRVQFDGEDRPRSFYMSRAELTIVPS